MKFFPIVLANFRRHKVRVVLTILSIAVAFILFGYLSAIRNAFAAGIDVAGADRLIVRHRVSIIQMLPESYEAQIEQVKGVRDATPASWFGGIYQDPKNFFAQLPVKPEEYLAMYPEILLPADQKKAWLETRTGAIVGNTIAQKFGWKVGDRVPIQATIWQPAGGGSTWEFDIVGIYTGAEKGTDTSTLFFRHDYFEENRRGGKGTVGWYLIKIDDPDRAPGIARQIDDRFLNSPAETKTETEGAFIQAFADQVGNIGAIVVAILTAVFFTILLVAGNTIAQSVRERTRELGTLKALGFSDRRVMTFVLTESLLIAFIGGAIGLVVAALAIAGGDPTGGALPIFYFPARDQVIGIALIVLLGIVTGLLPAIQAMRLNTVEALRRE